MTTTLKKMGALVLASAVTLAMVSGKAMANGEIGDHVNNLHAHIGEYTEEVHWLESKFGSVVDAYEAKDKALKTDALIEYWEEVDFHSAIETQYVPIYASIWQGIYGVKMAIDGNKPIQVVREEQEKLNHALWQALGAVKLASQYQKKGLVDAVKTTEKEPTTGPEVIDDIKTRLDRVVAKYAEQLHEVATTLVHDTYLQRFEGVEGDLIAQDAALVEDLEKDFNVTLPQAISKDKGVDSVRKVVETMQTKLDRARVLLVEAEKSRKDVF
ncbi:hypothetical protein LHL20_05300 [Alteromonas sp. McT4-15]|jgi:hypothetical protein|uniref:hypothetical protein n=1 Tax=Alteromonas sp. McT4-15 TaxID=2881256 RepID=UPI001CF8C42F|nr:hypothetical protein [Alteromonas sp. McT4-15]MCB4435658.1 hypothetical protein [Alteromonas sp. McT4-15]|tara:strand:+ start:550 stop:1359 length:810 start_codon:yes stop_codon:yes gene_type:complete